MGWGHIDVEAVYTHLCAGVVAEMLAEDDDFTGVSFGVDDAVPGADGFVSATDMVEGCGDLRTIGGMLVPHYEVSCGGDGPGLVPVDPGNLRRPFPAVVCE